MGASRKVESVRNDARKSNIEISGVMVRTVGFALIVECEVDGRWIQIFNERIAMPDGSEPRIGHIIEPLGIRQRAAA